VPVYARRKRRDGEGGCIISDYRHQFSRAGAGTSEGHAFTTSVPSASLHSRFHSKDVARVTSVQ
jgi:hypothetical protein